MNPSDLAVLIPCFNEELTVGKVVSEFRNLLPGAAIHVFDNNSTDRTAEIARGSGATVIPSPRPGKGHVVRQMFSDVEARVYLMVDGDDTYPASQAPELLREFERGDTDMVVGARTTRGEKDSFPRFHLFGNRLISRLISLLFGVRVSDVMSGYRVLSRQFVKTLPLMAGGFEIEAELTLQAIAKGYAIREVPVRYRGRPTGSHSKLRTFSDGWRVMKTIFLIFKNFKPLLFFTFLAALFAVLSLLAGWGPIQDYMTTGLVPRFPRAILAAALGILSAISIGVGLILDTLARYQRENFELWRKRLE